jgi:hypothetical protein
MEIAAGEPPSVAQNDKPGERAPGEPSDRPVANAGWREGNSRTINRIQVTYRASGPPTNEKEALMSIHVALQPLIALIAGILILIVPRLLNYVVAIYLIIVGLIGLAPMLHL